MEDHSRTIIHIDIDCFYAQVEMVKDQSLMDKPVGIQQKNIVVTSNYNAREYGIKKCMLVAEAQKLCPKLVLINGEDLYNYRQTSYKVTSVLQVYSETVERLGLDENFIDVTELVNKRLKSSGNLDPTGCKFGEADALCDCGCSERISMGSHIAQEIRDIIFKELHLTVCAGIAHNKLLAKIVGSRNKPNKQTFVFPNNATELLASLDLVQNIPWVGTVTAEQLSTINITKVSELQNCSIMQLKNLFGFEKAENIWNSSFGIDNSPVKKTGKPQSIGLEDSCKALTTEKEVEEKLKCLLRRLMILVKEDERVPKTIKLSVRKLNNKHPSTGIRETRQCNIYTSLDNEAQTMNTIMTLFKKAVNTKTKYWITLLGLSFTKFDEKIHIKNTLTNFFTRDIKNSSDIDLKNHSEPSTSIIFKTENITSPEHPSDSNELIMAKIKNSALLIKPNTMELKFTNTIIQSNEKMGVIIKCPPGVNEEVFRELPSNLQEEVWNDHKRKREIDQTQRPCKKVKATSILNYIVRK